MAILSCGNLVFHGLVMSLLRFPIFAAVVEFSRVIDADYQTPSCMNRFHEADRTAPGMSNFCLFFGTPVRAEVRHSQRLRSFVDVGV